MDYTNRVRRITDEELEEINRNPLGFFKGLMIATGIGILFWAAVVALWVIF